jgi:hypothetical protein
MLSLFMGWEVPWVDPTLIPVDGVPYSQYLLDSGWTALNATLLSHSTYTPGLNQLPDRFKPWTPSWDR